MLENRPHIATCDSAGRGSTGGVFSSVTGLGLFGGVFLGSSRLISRSPSARFRFDRLGCFSATPEGRPWHINAAAACVSWILRESTLSRNCGSKCTFTHGWCAWCWVETWACSSILSDGLAGSTGPKQQQRRSSVVRSGAARTQVSAKRRQTSRCSKLEASSSTRTR